MEEHDMDIDAEQLMDEMRYKMYEIDTIKDAIVAHQRATIEALKGRLDYSRKNESDHQRATIEALKGRLDYESDQERFLAEKEKLEKDKNVLEIAQANFEIEKEYYQHLIDKANKDASAEKDRSETLASALYKLKLDMSKSINMVDEWLDQDLEVAIVHLQRARAESTPYGV